MFGPAFREWWFELTFTLESRWEYPADSARLLLEIGFRAAVLLLVTLALQYLLRRDDAVVRDRLWRLTVVAALLLPVLGTVAPRWHLPLVPLTAVAPPLPAQTAPLEGDPLDPASLRPATEEEAARAGFEIWPPHFGILAGAVGRSVLGLWAAGALVLFLALGLGVVRLQRLARGGRRHGPTAELAAEVAGSLGLHRRPRVLIHDRVASPIAFGILRPAVLLPTAAVDWPVERQRVVLLHELTHVQRWDGLFQLLALALRALYWPLPFAWRAVAALERERELACDERVLAAGERPSDYASHLLAVARQLRTPATAMAMAAPARLEERVRSILRPERPPGALAASVIIAVTLLLTLPTLAGVNPWSPEPTISIADDGRSIGWSDDYLRLEIDRGLALLGSRDWPAAAAHFQRVLRSSPHAPRAWFLLGYAQLMGGRIDDGLASSLEAARYVGFRSSGLYNAACGFARKGELETSLHALGLAIDHGLAFPAATVRGDSDFKALHGDPRFEALLNRLD